MIDFLDKNPILKSNCLPRNQPQTGHTTPVLFSNTDIPFKTEFSDLIISNVTFEEVDFNASIFKHCRFEKCLFKKCNMNNTRFFESSEFIECRFTQTDFSSVGTDGCAFEKTIFDKTDLISTSVENFKLSECTFRRCKMKDLEFDCSKLDKVEFEGTLTEITFTNKSSRIPAPVINLEKSKFNGVHFKNIDTSSIKLSSSDDVIYIDNLRTKVPAAITYIQQTEPEGDLKKVLLRRINSLFKLDNQILDIAYMSKYDQDRAFWDKLIQIINSMPAKST